MGLLSNISLCYGLLHLFLCDGNNGRLSSSRLGAVVKPVGNVTNTSQVNNFLLCNLPAGCKLCAPTKYIDGSLNHRFEFPCLSSESDLIGDSTTSKCTSTEAQVRRGDET